MYVIKNWYMKFLSDDFQNNLWTFIASTVTAVFSFTIVLFTTRLVGLAEAGVVSFAIATALLAQNIIFFGVRSFQSTDINQEFSFQSYLGLRVCSSFLALACIGIFLLVGRMDTSRTIVIFLVFVIFLIDGFADVFMGSLQQKGKMRIAGRMRVCAFSLCILFFLGSLLIFRVIYFPLLLSCIIIFIVYLVWIWIYRDNFKPIRVKIDIHTICTIAKNVLPLLLSGVLFSYLVNMQKYYLGFLNTDESVAIITMLIMPVTALQLLSTTFFAGAEMTKSARVFVDGQIDCLYRRVKRQLLVALLLSLFFLLCVYTFGLDLLSWIFATDLLQYKAELMIMSIGGSLYTALAVLTACLVVLRKQKSWLYSMLTISCTAAPLMLFVVYRYGITGAAYSNLVILTPLTIILCVICQTGLKRAQSDKIAI